MQIYLPIADLPVNIFLILAMGAAVGFVSGMFGIGGGFLMTPLLIFVGIAPAVAIRQKNTTRNPRSTVATSTECYDFLRLLYARVGQTWCPNCNVRVRKDTVDDVAERVMALPEGSRWYALFPCGKHATNDALRDHLFDLRKKGFNRLFQGGRLFEFSTPESLLDIDFGKPLFVLVDRLAIGPGNC